MGMVLLNLIPLIVGAAILPMWFVVSLLLLRSGGVAKAAAFSLGAICVRVAQGALFGSAARAGVETTSGKHLAMSISLIVLGVVLWAAAVIRWWREGPPRVMPQKWMDRLSKVSVVQAFGIGAVLMAIAVKPFAFTLSAIAVIEEGRLGWALSVVAFLVFVIGAQLLVLSPVIVSVAAPTRSVVWLDEAQRWLQRNNRIVTVVVSMVFGSWFFYKGTTALLAGSRARTPESLWVEPHGNSGGLAE